MAPMWVCSSIRVTVSLLLLQLAAAYYLPGTYPQEFRVGDPLNGEYIWFPKYIFFCIQPCLP